MIRNREKAFFCGRKNYRCGGRTLDRMPICRKRHAAMPLGVHFIISVNDCNTPDLIAKNKRITYHRRNDCLYTCGAYLLFRKVPRVDLLEICVTIKYEKSLLICPHFVAFK